MSIGSGKLIRDNLPKDRIEILNKIHNIIEEDFRSEAKNKKNNSECDNNNQFTYKKRYNNVISILGGRGSGKTSMGITVLKELAQNNIYAQQENNIVLEIIDPAMFNVEKNSLGWVLYLLSEKVEQFKNEKTPFCTNDDFSKIEDEYRILKEKYFQSRVYYKNNIASLSDGRYDFQKVNEKSIFTEISLEKDFKDFLYKFIECCKQKNRSRKKRNEDKEIEEPLIFITFDDVDLSPQVGPEILEAVLNYLDHPNIVVLILGDYDTFKESMVLDLWNKSKVPEQIDKDTIINKESIMQGFSIRAEDILGKVLPPAYRFDLEGLSLEDRLKYTPMGDGTKDKMIKKFNSVELTRIAMGRVDGSVGSTTLGEHLINWFIEPTINVKNIRFYYNNLKENRNYQGFEEDESRLNKHEEQYENRGRVLETFINRWDNEDKLIYEPKLYANVLPNTPRSLISLYNDFENENSDNLIMTYINGYLFFTGYAVLTEKAEENFNNIYILYNLLKKNNININSNRNKYDIDKIVSIDKKRKKIKFNLRNLKFKSENGFKYFSYNCSTNLLKCVYIAESNIEYELDDTQSAFIQLIYDLALNFLTTDEYVEIEGKLDFSNITLYKNEDNNLDIRMINTKTFREYYTFMKLYELCLPIIIQDKRVQRNTRTRLKLSIISILNHIIEERNRKPEYMPFEWLQNNEEYLDKIWSEFYENNNSDLVDGKMSTLYFLRFFEETSNPYEIYFDYYINSDNYLINYNRLASLINNTIEIEKRTIRIADILEEVEGFDYSSITIDKGVIKRLKEVNETKDWNKIRLILFEIESVFVLRIGLSIFYDYISLDERRDSLHKLIESYTKQKERVVRSSKKDTHRYNQTYNQVYERFMKLEKDMYNETQNGVKEVRALIQVYEKVNMNSMEDFSSNINELSTAAMTLLNPGQVKNDYLLGDLLLDNMDTNSIYRNINNEILTPKRQKITSKYIEELEKTFRRYQIPQNDSIYGEILRLIKEYNENKNDKTTENIKNAINKAIEEVENLKEEEQPARDDNNE